MKYKLPGLFLHTEPGILVCTALKRDRGTVSAKTKYFEIASTRYRTPPRSTKVLDYKKSLLS